MTLRGSKYDPLESRFKFFGQCYTVYILVFALVAFRQQMELDQKSPGRHRHVATLLEPGSYGRGGLGLELAVVFFTILFLFIANLVRNVINIRALGTSHLSGSSNEQDNLAPRRAPTC
jgi:hypothetical protein